MRRRTNWSWGLALVVVLFGEGCPGMTGAGEGEPCSGHGVCRPGLVCHEKSCVTQETVQKRREKQEREVSARIEKEAETDKKRFEAEMKAAEDMLRSLEGDSDEARKLKEQIKSLEEENARAAASSRGKTK